MSESDKGHVDMFKPLEWVGPYAHTPFGLYYYIEFDGKLAVLEEILGAAILKSSWETVAQARNAAQKRYEERLASALRTDVVKENIND